MSDTNHGSPVCLTQPTTLPAARQASTYTKVFPWEPLQGCRLVLTHWLRGSLRASSQEQPYIQQPHPHLHSSGISPARDWLLLQSHSSSVDPVQKEVFIYCLSNVPGLSLQADKPRRASGLARQAAWLPVGSSWLAVVRGLPRQED